jgi:hypothetical protein
MINPFKEVNWNPDTAAKRKFALSLIIGFPCVALALLLLRRLISGGWHLGPALWLAGIGAAAGIVLRALPGIARPFYRAWYFVSCCIGIVISNVLLAAFYFIVLTLVGLVMRAIGRQPLRKGFEKNAATYWNDAEQVTDPKRYYSQF